MRRVWSDPRAATLFGWTVALLAFACWTWLRLGSAAAEAAAADAGLRALDHDLERLHALRDRSQSVAQGRRPDADLIARVERALADAGLPVTACSGVQPRADQNDGRGGVHVQTVQLALRDLRPADLGAWLAAWTASAQPWRVSELQLAHAQVALALGSAPGASLDSNRFDVSLVLAAPYLEQ